MAEKSYVDFDLQLESDGDGYRAQVLDSPGGQAQAAITLPFSELELENFVLRVGQRRRGRRRIESHDLDAARQFGATLFDTIIREDVANAYRSSLVWAQTHGMGLRIRLRLSGAPGLIDIPWEFLFDRSARRFVALSVDSPIVRFLDVPGMTEPLRVEPPIKILAVIASPSDFEPLQVEDEWSRLCAVADSVAALSIERLEKPTLSELQRALRREYHILHFVGHGGFDEATQDGLLVFEDEQGRGNEVSATYLATLLHDADSLRLAVLNACDGARGSRTDQFSGVAQSLLQQGVPAVVAMQFEISDDAALTFAREFYRAFSEGLPVEAALAEARKSMFAQQNDSEWATPVLYLRSVGSDIFEITQPAETAPAAPETVMKNMEPVQLGADFKRLVEDAPDSRADPASAETDYDAAQTRTAEPPMPETKHSDGLPPGDGDLGGEPGESWWKSIPRSRVAVGAGLAGVIGLLLIVFLATRGDGRQGNPGAGDLGRRQRFAHVPLANAVTVPAFGDVEMDVAFVVTIRAGAEHRAEAVAGAFAQGHAQILRHGHVGRADRAAVGEREGAQIKGIALAVLAHPRAEYPVAAAAFEIVVVLDVAQGHAGFVEPRHRFVADPGGKRLRHLATEHRRRTDVDADMTGGQDCGELHHVAPAACTRPDQARHRLDRGDGLEPLAASGRFGGDGGGIKIGASGLPECVRLKPGRRARPRQGDSLSGDLAAAKNAQQNHG